MVIIRGFFCYHNICRVTNGSIFIRQPEITVLFHVASTPTVADQPCSIFFRLLTKIVSGKIIIPSYNRYCMIHRFIFWIIVGTILSLINIRIFFIAICNCCCAIFFYHLFYFIWIFFDVNLVYILQMCDICIISKRIIQSLDQTFFRITVWHRTLICGSYPVH